MLPFQSNIYQYGVCIFLAGVLCGIVALSLSNDVKEAKSFKEMTGVFCVLLIVNSLIPFFLAFMYSRQDANRQDEFPARAPDRPNQVDAV